MELAQCHRAEVSAHQVPIEERTIKDFFDRRHDDGGTCDAHYDIKPRRRRTFPKLPVRIPTRIKDAQSCIVAVQSHPCREDAETYDHCFPTDFPPHLLRERAHFPHQPSADYRLSKIKPITGIFSQFSLQGRQQDEHCKRRYSGKLGRTREFLSKKIHWRPIIPVPPLTPSKI